MTLKAQAPGSHDLPLHASASNTDAEKTAAAQFAASRATDADDLRMLLAMLGLEAA